MTHESGVLLGLPQGHGEREAGAAATRSLFTIGEIAREFGFTLRALRFYEEKGLISPRRNGNRRLYSAEDRQRLEIIANGKKIGMPLDDIHEILRAGSANDDTPMIRVALEKATARLDALEAEKAQVESFTREALKLIDGLNKKLSDKASAVAG
ncbi:MerR family transcriptional regulator [Microbaculum marinisediminis]|uniref:MerR family transcriptional regulator n=1 Tax=Microbaculum marinisediminis TaxID=2931392 RepID=A0AAW5QXI1_9HYPH|nr:MerR family transcriptional regulator [Microbaculum sp. A6E488]MCT8971113.1 MerR family transcriptional regulator [Microbaculum sp. A6E488]